MAWRISACSAKGGACKTTTVIGLAATWMTRNKRVVVADIDPNQVAYHWIKDSEALAGIEVVRVPTDVPTIEDLIEKYDGACDVLLMDVLGGDSDIMTLCAANSTLTLIPMNDSPLDARQTIRTLERIQQADLAIREKRGRGIPHAVLMSRADPGTTVYKILRDEVEKAAAPVLDAVIHARVIHKEAAYIGSSPILMDAKHPAAREIAGLADEIEALIAANELAHQEA